MRTVTLMFLLVACMPTNIFADRNPPTHVKPITRYARVFNYTFEKQKGGFAVSLVAKKVHGKSLIWKTQLYSKTYDPTLEADVHDIFIDSLVLEKKILVAKDEHGQVYRVDSENGKLLSPGKSVQY